MSTTTRADYVIQVDRKTHCQSNNGHVVSLLCPEFFPASNVRDEGPMFYICWECRKVFQVGVGEVHTDTTHEEEHA